MTLHNRLINLAQRHRRTRRICNHTHPTKLTVPRLTHNLPTQSHSPLTRSPRILHTNIRAPKTRNMRLRATPHTRKSRPIRQRRRIPRTLDTRSRPTKQLRIKLHSLHIMISACQLVPHRSTRLPTSDKSLLAMRLNHTKQRPRRIRQQRHRTQLHLRRRSKNRATQLASLRNRRLDIISQKMRHPHIRRIRILRLRNQPSHRQTLTTRQTIPRHRLLKLPPQQFRIKMSRLADIATHQVDPIRHPVLGHKCRHSASLSVNNFGF